MKNTLVYFFYAYKQHVIQSRFKIIIIDFCNIYTAIRSEFIRSLNNVTDTKNVSVEHPLSSFFLLIRLIKKNNIIPILMDILRGCIIFTLTIEFCTGFQ